jgi:hypothetical protein
VNPLINQRRAWNEEPLNGYYQKNHRQYQLERPKTWNKQSSSFYVPKGGRSMQPPQVMDTSKQKDDHYEDWEHYYAHRDRRDLYQRIETVLG